MTSEIALLNRRAVALAADSATTTKYYDRTEGKWKTRYFTGANKIFNLSKVHPVGLMTYDSANIHGVPWDLIAKAYRENLDEREFDYLEEYATDFFKFIQENKDLFSGEYLKERFLVRADQIASIALMILRDGDSYKAAKTNKEKKKAIDVGLKARVLFTNKSNIIGNIKKKEVDDIVAELKDELSDRMKKDSFFAPHLKYISTDKFSELGIRGYFAEDIPGHETTGIVFAGYGKREYFPCVIQYKTYGIVRGKAIYSKGDETKITHGDISRIIPFAKTQMVRTFIYGISGDAMVEMQKAYYQSIDKFVDDLTSKHGLPAKVDVEADKKAAHKEFDDIFLDQMIKTHSQPLRRVVGSLPINELVELAETLVLIESLKEQVTTDEESIGRPIDVAVISKSDGFIWIKRKHYFDPELNPRFFARLN